MKLHLKFLILITFFFLTSCGGGKKGTISGTENPNNYRGTLISFLQIGSKNATFLRPYSVKAYKIVYYTIGINGNKTKASGLLSIPQKNTGEKSPIISYQHGTIFLNEQAPSISSTSVNAIMTLAGMGYIVSAPDFLGYGESSGQIHPYIHADSLSSASIDMLRASKSFLRSNSINTNRQLFLTGYSEGGYATLALQKAIQENHSGEFSVTASAAGAGPFDLTETSVTMANKVTNEHPAYMSFLLKAYDTVYGLNKIPDMYQPQYVNAVNTLFDGNNSGNTITNSLTTTTADLFTPIFLEALKGTEQHIIKEKLALNNIYDWKPIVPTRFYHGPNDEVVPYSNSQKALSTMRNNGATEVSLGDCFLNTHVKCAIPYVLDTLNFFNKYVNDL